MSNKAVVIERIKILEAKSGKSGNTLGKEAGLANGTVDGWSDNQIEKPNLAVRQFLGHHNIREEWWKTGNGDIFNTPVQNRTDNKEKSLEETIEALLAELRENNRWLRSENDKLNEFNEKLRADLRSATDQALNIATVALAHGKKK